MKPIVNDFCCVCSNCSKACPVDAPYYDGEKIAIDYDKCIQCGSCIEACLMGALSDADNPAPAVQPHEPVEKSCDFCVLGGGAAGLIAAAKVAESGKSVILLEKGSKFAGSTPYATGLRLFDTAWDKRDGRPSRIEQMKEMARRNTRGELNDALIDNAMEAIPAFFDWCEGWTDMNEYFSVRKNPFGEFGLDVHDSEHGAGIFVIKKFPERCKELGVEILHETSAKSFIKDESGAIVGVVANDPGGEVVISFKQCLIATGSLINGETLKKAVPEYADAFTRRYGHRLYSLTGDGVDMAEKAGIPINYEKISVAYIGNLCMPVDMQGIHYGRPIDTEMLKQIGRADAIRVNREGKRWMNEGDYSGTVINLLAQPQCASWTILDSEMISEVVEDPAADAIKAGTSPMLLHGIRTPGAVYGKAADLEKLQEFAKLQGKHLVIADTIEELAEKAGLPVEELKNTIEQYNASCAKGEDEQHGKSAEYLRPIAKAPFYAFATFLATDGAFGGIEVDENMHVIGADGIIENLYAAGDVCSSYYVIGGIDRKDTIINDFTWACASGYIAGCVAAK